MFATIIPLHTSILDTILRIADVQRPHHQITNIEKKVNRDDMKMSKSKKKKESKFKNTIEPTTYQQQNSTTFICY